MGSEMLKGWDGEGVKEDLGGDEVHVRGVEAFLYEEEAKFHSQKRMPPSSPMGALSGLAGTSSARGAGTNGAGVIIMLPLGIALFIVAKSA
ncbi:hypothetical protein COCNU_scaffold018181G000010 [Cocos nucifera]|nr:hypothetical protein [Cocos nucifera]